MLILQEVIDSVWADCQMYIGLMPVRELVCILVKELCWTVKRVMFGFAAWVIIRYSYKVITLTTKLVGLLEMLFIKYTPKHTLRYSDCLIRVFQLLTLQLEYCYWKLVLLLVAWLSLGIWFTSVSWWDAETSSNGNSRSCHSTSSCTR